MQQTRSQHDDNDAQASYLYRHCGLTVSLVIWNTCNPFLFSLVLNVLFIAGNVCFNTLKPRQNGRHFPYDIFEMNFLEWKCINFDRCFTKVCSQGSNIPALVKIMAWRRPGDKPLSEPMMVNLLTRICVTRPQSVNVQHAVDYIDAPSSTVCVVYRFIFLLWSYLYIIRSIE